MKCHLTWRRRLQKWPPMNLTLGLICLAGETFVKVIQVELEKHMKLAHRMKKPGPASLLGARGPVNSQPQLHIT